MISWGGAETPAKDGDYPPMANDHLPNGFYKDTFYFDNIRYVNPDRMLVIPKQSDTTSRVNMASCYGQTFTELTYHEVTWFSFMFGGPGGKCV